MKNLIFAIIVTAPMLLIGLFLGSLLTFRSIETQCAEKATFRAGGRMYSCTMQESKNIWLKLID